LNCEGQRCVIDSWWRIETYNTRIVGNWRTRLKTWSWVQDRLSSGLRYLYCNSNSFVFIQTFLKEIYFSISCLEIGREAYRTTKREQRKSRNSLITSFVFFYFSLSLSVLSLSILWNSILVLQLIFCDCCCWNLCTPTNTWDHYFWKKTSTMNTKCSI
jgi:hypothetical protein